MSKAKKNNKIDGKPDLSLIPYEFMSRVAKVMEFGADKYGRYNYLKGHDNMDLTAAAVRHIKQFEAGKDYDDESSLCHLAHAASCMLLLIEQQAKGTSTDTRYYPESVENEDEIDNSKHFDEYYIGEGKQRECIQVKYLTTEGWNFDTFDIDGDLSPSDVADELINWSGWEKYKIILMNVHIPGIDNSVLPQYHENRIKFVNDELQEEKEEKYYITSPLAPHLLRLIELGDLDKIDQHLKVMREEAKEAIGPVHLNACVNSKHPNADRIYSVLQDFLTETSEKENPYPYL